MTDDERAREIYDQIFIADACHSKNITIIANALRAQREELEAKAKGLVEASEFAHMTLEHAQALGYLGEGSTMGMANDAIQKLSEALAAYQEKT